MNRYGSERDLSTQQRMAQPSAPLLLLYVICGHKGLRAGGYFRGRVAMRCPACNKEKT